MGGAIVRLATTNNFISLAYDSKGRNRGPNQELLAKLDPDGIHVITLQMIHNDIEWRCVWLCKISDETDPIRIMMDNGMEALDRHTYLKEVPQSQAS